MIDDIALLLLVLLLLVEVASVVSPQAIIVVGQMANNVGSDLYKSSRGNKNSQVNQVFTSHL
jgi:hypothetical protein